MSRLPIRLLIVDDQTLFRQGLSALFEAEPDIEVLAQLCNGAEALSSALTLGPDVIVMNIMMPVMDGLVAARRIKKANPKIEILFVASNFHEDNVRDGFEAGGRGYLLKGCDFQELLFAVKKAAHGDYYISGAVGPDLVSVYVNNHLKSQRPGGLMTPREKELARLLADGYSTKEAAEVLSISPKTAETHRASIMRKLKAKNVTDIVRYCIRNHIIEP